MKIIAKYPIIVQGKNVNKTIVNDKYEGGFDNADGDPTTTPVKKKSFLEKLEGIADSGLIEKGIDIANKVKSSKGQPGAMPGQPPVPTGGPSGPSGGKGSPDASHGMSTGAKVGIAVGLIGLGVVIFLVVKHNKK